MCQNLEEYNVQRVPEDMQYWLWDMIVSFYYLSGEKKEDESKEYSARCKSLILSIPD